MDLAQTLVRSVTRAFFTAPEDRRMVTIVDALVLHSTLRDDDLAHLMSLNAKDLHRICRRLEEERLLVIHHRSEIKEGKEKASPRMYYYIDYRQAIDAIKYRTFKLDKKVQGDAIPAQEKKEYFCTFCKAEWTTLEVLDKMGPEGFLCHRCDSLLNYDPDREAGGHEVSTRLNNQLKFIIDMLPQLDTATIPEGDFETAYAAAVPVIRDAANQVAPSIAVENLAKPTAVKGMANTGPQSIAISITDTDAPTEAEKEAERARKEAAAQMNALPEWHTTSTVTGLSYGGNANSTVVSKADEGTDQKPNESVADAAHERDLQELFRTLEEAKRRQALEDDDDDDDDEEDDDAESAGAEFVDISANVSSVGEKRFASSGPTSAADTPTSDRPAKKVKVAEPANGGESEDDDDMQFEDV
ncbi:hypothetical protein F4677DRAFT_435387 [Hypoxylon crocopeplum]|nr:hypothetical protein F4677DRAFT_435387 [Hypoxylon crocopeplum]